MPADATISTDPSATELGVVSRPGVGEDRGDGGGGGDGAERALGGGETSAQGGVGNMTMTTDASREDKTGQEDKEYITGVKLLAVMGSVTLTAFLMMLDGSIISTVSTKACGRSRWKGKGVWSRKKKINYLASWQATPKITTDFHSLADVGWYVAAYQLARYVQTFCSR